MIPIMTPMFLPSGALASSSLIVLIYPATLILCLVATLVIFGVHREIIRKIKSAYSYVRWYRYRKRNRERVKALAKDIIETSKKLND